jgi:hypothetical protein
MTDEKWSPQPYSEQEFLSFDRLKRAVMNRVLDRSEALMVDEFPITPDRTAELIKEEWQRAKEAIRCSPAARQAFRKHLESVVSEQVDGMIKTDKNELGSMGVVEKSI